MNRELLILFPLTIALAFAIACNDSTDSTVERGTDSTPTAGKDSATGMNTDSGTNSSVGSTTSSVNTDGHGADTHSSTVEHGQDTETGSLEDIVDTHTFLDGIEVEDTSPNSVPCTADEECDGGNGWCLNKRCRIVAHHQWRTPTSEYAAGMRVTQSNRVVLSGTTTTIQSGSSTDIRPDAVAISIATDGQPDWTLKWGTTSSEYLRDIAACPSGNVYAAGVTYGEFNGFEDRGHDNIFVTGISPAGKTIWTTQWQTQKKEESEPARIFCDSEGNLLVLGNIFKSYDDDATHDFLLLQVTPDGAMSELTRFGSEGFDSPKDMARDSDGHLIVAGSTTGNLVQPNNGEFDALLMKLDAQGNVVWQRQWGGLGEDYAVAVALNDNAIYVAGNTFSNLASDALGGGDFYLAKFNLAGDRLWIRQMGTIGREEAKGIAIDSSGYIYVVGHTDGEMAQPIGSNDFFISSFTPNGDLLWTRQWGTKSSELAYSIEFDSKGNLYVMGISTGDFEGLPGTVPSNLVLTMIKYQENGN